MLISMVAALGCWLFVTARMRRHPSGGTHQTKLLASSFFYSFIYSLLTFLPHLLLFKRPEDFPLAMAVGFIVGHVFLYIGFLYFLRVTFSMIPRLNNKEHIAIIVGTLVITSLSVFTAITMLTGERPEFIAETGRTAFNAHPLVSSGSALIAMVGVVPAAILMIVNGTVNARTRLRSFLIGGGLIILMIAGPLHETELSTAMYVFVNSLSVIGLVSLVSGVAYRMEDKMTLAKQENHTQHF